MSEQTILDNSYSEAKRILELNEKKITPNKDVDLMINKIGQNKSIVSALVTSLVKKLLTPDQDVRLHRTDFHNGYSARVLDTKFTSPFFKKKFPKYANKESSFLTLSTREKIKWTKEDGVNLKIRNKNLKESFLNIFDQIENHNKNPEDYLIYIFIKLIELSVNDEKLFLRAEKFKKNSGVLNINLILEMLHKHFSIKLSSRLPVIAIYSVYEILIPILKRYNNKKLLSLQSHTSSDKHGYGDIEVYSNDNNPFEVIEIKHNIPIDKYLIFDIVKKIEKTNINRYYILTTYFEGFETKENEKEVNKFILQIKTSKNIDIIANGIITTLKYYLRFFDDYNLFIKHYTKNLIEDAKHSTEIKSFHIENWIDILKEYGFK